MHALITGGAGFIGSHLAERLIRDGHTVSVIDDLSTGVRTNLTSLQGDPRFRFIWDSISSETVLSQVVSEVDVVFHLAAAVGVQLIIDEPARTIETNVHGTEVVLNCAKKYGAKVIIASTSEVYGKNTKIPFSEDDDTLLGPTIQSRWSYASSKMIDEFLALAYHRRYGLQTVICRFFNTVGPRQIGTYGMVVPRFVQRALKEDALIIHGDGRQSRCFCNVKDTVEALVRLAACNEAVGKVINIGNDELITISELADVVIQLTRSRSEKKFISYEDAYGTHFDDMQIRQPDLKRLESLVGFRPSTPVRDTLLEVIAFERARAET